MKYRNADVFSSEHRSFLNTTILARYTKLLHRSESGTAHKLCLSINKNAKRLMLSWLNIRTSATGNPINAVRTVPSSSLRERSARKRKRSPAQYIRKHLPKYGRASAIQLRLLYSGC